MALRGRSLRRFVANRVSAVAIGGRAQGWPGLTGIVTVETDHPLADRGKCCETRADRAEAAARLRSGRAVASRTGLVPLTALAEYPGKRRAESAQGGATDGRA